MFKRNVMYILQFIVYSDKYIFMQLYIMVKFMV